MSGPRTYFAIDLKSYYASAECAARGLDPVQKTLRLVLDSPHTGPGVEKEKVVVIPLEDIVMLACIHE